MTIIRLMVSFLYVLIPSLLVITIESKAQDQFEKVFPLVVQISTSWGKGGTGIIIQKSENETGILTARHVVWQPNLWKQGLFEEQLCDCTRISFGGKVCGKITRLIYEEDLERPDIALIKVEGAPPMDVEPFKFRKKDNEVGSDSWILPYPKDISTKPDVMKAEINRKDNQYYYFGLKSGYNLIGGESGSPVLDADKNVIGIVREAAGRTDNKAIKSSVICDVLDDWEEDYQSVKELERVAFANITVADDKKIIKSDAKWLQNRAFFYLRDFEFFDIQHDSTKELTKVLNAELLKKGKKYKINFKLKNYPDDGLPPTPFKAEAENIDKLVESSVKEIVKQLDPDFKVRFQGVPSNRRKWSGVITFAGIAATGIMATIAYENKVSYEGAITSQVAKRDYDRLHCNEIIRNSAAVITVGSLLYWLYASFIDPRRPVFERVEVK